METKTVLLLGRPGCGKSTQLERLRGVLPDAEFLSFGTLARAFMREEHEAARRARALLEHGEVLPKFLSTALWAPYLFKHLAPDRSLVLEGAPRHRFEAESLDSFLAFYERPGPIVVINIEVSETDAVSRLSSRGAAEGRADDLALESIWRRQQWYETETVPVLAWLRENPRYQVTDVDGTQSPDEVARAITAAVS